MGRDLDDDPIGEGVLFQQALSGADSSTICQKRGHIFSRPSTYRMSEQLPPGMHGWVLALDWTEQVVGRAWWRGLLAPSGSCQSAWAQQRAQLWGRGELEAAWAPGVGRPPRTARISLLAVRENACPPLGPK